ncbi:MAG: replication factor C large subunit [Candidatus Woesearchaeota archaeon]
MSLYSIKYAPQNSSEVVGQALAIPLLKDFIHNYKKQKKKAALIYGPVGCGKTSAIYALAKELKYDILEINSSDIRNEANMSSFLGSALGQQSLFFTPKIVLIDEIDNISGTHDRGCIPALVRALEKSSFPVILTANDPFDSKFSALRKACQMIEFGKLDYKIISQILIEICAKEKIKFEEKAIASLARKVDGDLRGALIDLQICAAKESKFTYDDLQTLSDRKRTESILHALMLIFKSSTVENALPALEETDTDLNEVFLWIDENLPKEYLDPASLARAYEHLSRADVFNRRIKRWQHWRFLVYIYNFLTAGISSAKDKKNPEFVQYTPTMRVLKIWQANQKWAKRKEIAEKLAAKTHTSIKEAVQQVCYFQSILRNSGGEGIIKELELTEEEVEWMRK